MFSEWFGGIFFRARGKLSPKLVLQDGTLIVNPDVQKYDVLRELLEESQLKFEDRPMILYNGTHNIHHLDKLFVTDHYRKVLQNNQVAVYFFEPLTHYDPSDGSHPHIIKIDNADNEIEQVRCHELDSLQEWATANEINDICVYCTDYKSWEYYQPLYPKLKLFSFDLFVSWYVDRATLFEKRHPSGPLPQKLYADKIIKKFWSGAWRYEPYRNFISAYLAGRGIAQESHVSFYFKVPNRELRDRLWFDWETFHKKHPMVANTVMQGNQILQEIVPLSIEVENPKALDESRNDPEICTNGEFNIRGDQNPVKSYKESFCVIIQESRFSQPWPNISEKTLNAIINQRPFIMCGPPGTLHMLREMGFQTFDGYWPEDYDEIVSNQDRLARICEVIDYVNSFSIDDLKQVYGNMQSILFHNNEKIKDVNNFYFNLNDNLKRNFQDIKDQPNNRGLL